MAKDLIIVRAGKGSLHLSWLDRGKSPRSWDLLVCPYEDIPPQPTGVFLSDLIVASAKFAGLKVLLKEWQAWRDYRYVMLVDDDVFATQKTWSRFFECCEQFGAKLAQPALLESSYFGHTVTVRNTEFRARRVSFVEGMTPCFRTDILADMLATFDLSKSGEGWGLDFLWPKKLGYKDVFVIDETTVLHTRLHKSHADPTLHRKLNEEMEKIMRDNQVPWLLKTFTGILPSGEEIDERHPAFLYRLFHGYERVFAQDPRRFEEMIRLQLATFGKR